MSCEKFVPTDEELALWTKLGQEAVERFKEKAPKKANETLMEQNEVHIDYIKQPGMLTISRCHDPSDVDGFVIVAELQPKLCHILHNLDSATHPGTQSESKPE